MGFVRKAVEINGIGEPARQPWITTAVLSSVACGGTYIVSSTGVFVNLEARSTRIRWCVPGRA